MVLALMTFSSVAFSMTRYEEDDRRESSSVASASTSSQRDDLSDDKKRSLFEVANDRYSFERWNAIETLWKSNDRKWRKQLFPVMMDVAEDRGHPQQLKMLGMLWSAYSSYETDREELDRVFQLVCSIALEGLYPDAGSKKAIQMLSLKQMTFVLLYDERKVFNVFKQITQSDRHPYRVEAFEALLQWKCIHDSEVSQMDVYREVGRALLQIIQSDFRSEEDVGRVLKAFTTNKDCSNVIMYIRDEEKSILSTCLLSILSSQEDNRNSLYLSVLKTGLRVGYLTGYKSPFIEEELFRHRIRIAEDDTHPEQEEMLNLIGLTIEQNPIRKEQINSLLRRISGNPNHPCYELALNTLAWIRRVHGE